MLTKCGSKQELTRDNHRENVNVYSYSYTSRTPRINPSCVDFCDAHDPYALHITRMTQKLEI